MDETAATGPGQAGPFTEMAIAWAHTGDGERPYRAVAGGAELVVRVNDFPAEPLYSLLVNGRPAGDLEDWPAAWIRPGTPAPLLRQAAAAQLRRGRLDAVVAAAWAGILCELPRSAAAGAVTALGLAGTLNRAASYWRLEPPPPGLTQFQVGEAGGDVTSVDVKLAAPVAGRAGFDALLGPGRAVPRVHYDAAHPVFYQVAAEGAGYDCAVFAYFDRPPDDGGPAQSWLLRRHPA